MLSQCKITHGIGILLTELAAVYVRLFGVVWMIPYVQYIWVQECRALLNTLPIVIVTFAINCWGEKRPIHLLGFVLKLDIDEVRTNRSYSCETIL